MSANQPIIALEARLRECRNVLTLGVRTNFEDYPPEQASLIRNASKIYYPTTFYADLFNTMGKRTFPSYHNYKCVQDKIKQTALFKLLGIPHPRTRIFYGKRQTEKIKYYFNFPMIGKVPRGSAMGRGVFLIQDQRDLEIYLQKISPAYIQEYLPAKRDIRVVVIGHRIAIAYWRIAPHGEFRSNVSLGGDIALESVPTEAMDLALHTAQTCGWDDVGIDILPFDNRFWVLEANMKYGREGFRLAGINYGNLMENLIADGHI